MIRISDGLSNNYPPSPMLGNAIIILPEEIIRCDGTFVDGLVIIENVGISIYWDSKHY